MEQLRETIEELTAVAGHRFSSTPKGASPELIEIGTQMFHPLDMPKELETFWQWCGATDDFRVGNADFRPPDDLGDIARFVGINAALLAQRIRTTDGPRIRALDTINLVEIGGFERLRMLAEITPGSDTCRIWSYAIEDATAWLSYPSITDMIKAAIALHNPDTDPFILNFNIGTEDVQAYFHPELFEPHIIGTGLPKPKTNTDLPIFPDHGPLRDPWPDHWIPRQT